MMYENELDTRIENGRKLEVLKIRILKKIEEKFIDNKINLTEQRNEFGNFQAFNLKIIQ